MRSSLAALCLSLACLPSCGNVGKLPPCVVPNPLRMWCRCEVVQTTQALAVADLPPSCTIPFVTTRCVDADIMGGLSEMLASIYTFSRNYSAPGGWPPYVTVGGNVYYLRCPAKIGGSSAADCISGQPGNPWPSYPIADLDSANPIRPGLRHPPRVTANTGGDGAGGGATSEGGDCALCLATAPCDGLTQMECITMHCAAVCPWDDASATCSDGTGGSPTVATSGCAASGEACGAPPTPLCCVGSGLTCVPSDVGATCQ